MLLVGVVIQLPPLSAAGASGNVVVIVVLLARSTTKPQSTSEAVTGENQSRLDRKTRETVAR